MSKITKTALIYVFIGAGKSTLINVLTGNLSATSGEAYFHGKQLSQNLPAIQKMTGIVPQHDRYVAFNIVSIFILVFNIYMQS